VLLLMVAALLSFAVLWAWRVEVTAVDAARALSFPSTMFPVARCFC
jgi:hypothetical protein